QATGTPAAEAVVIHCCVLCFVLLGPPPPEVSEALPVRGFDVLPKKPLADAHTKVSLLLFGDREDDGRVELRLSSVLRAVLSVRGKDFPVEPVQLLRENKDWRIRKTEPINRRTGGPGYFVWEQ